jgi:hypothetical protein
MAGSEMQQFSHSTTFRPGGRFGLWFSLLLLLLTAGCLPGSPAPAPATIAPPPSAVPTTTRLPPTATAPPVVAVTATAIPTESVPPTPTAQPIPTDLALSADSLQLYPVGPYYAGDVITIEIIPHRPPDLDIFIGGVALWIDDRPIRSLPNHATNFNGDQIFRYPWVWDTRGLEGEYPVTIQLNPAGYLEIGDEIAENNVLTTTITILPESARPADERGQVWISADGRHVRLHAVSGTVAARDLDQLVDKADRAVQAAATQMDWPLTVGTQINVWLIERILGQGGYAFGQTDYVISYSDRQYTSADLYQILLHETVHVLDSQHLTPQGPVSFLKEGLAVWAAGGHYKPEDLPRRAAALLENDLWIPLVPLLDNFYPSQHEIGYLQAGAFIAWLVESEGRERTLAMIAATNNRKELPPSAVLDQAAQEVLERTLAELEQAFIAWLQALPPDPDTDWSADLLLSIRLFELLRRYQYQYDRSANYLYGWLLYPPHLRNEGLTAPLTRRPATAAHLTLETLLQAAQETLVAGAFEEVAHLLDGVESALHGEWDAPLVNDYAQIVQVALAAGYEVRRIDWEGEDVVLVVAMPLESADPPPVRVTLELERLNERWEIIP